MVSITGKNRISGRGGLPNCDGNSSKVRESNLELYRIITMLLIVAHHYVVNSGLTLTDGPIYSDPLSGRSLFLLLFGAFGKTGINCFVLITGYFMCKSRITAKKFMKLLGAVMFYKIILYSIFWVTGYAPLTLKSVVQMILPFTSIAQNFTGCYLVFFLCIPFLNILIHNMNERQHIKILLIALFTYVIMGTVPFFSVMMNYVSWYIVLYFIASYIQMYPKKIFEKTKFWGWMSATCAIVSMISVVACTWLGTVIDRNISYFFVTDSNTFLAVATGVSSFLFFKNLRIKNNKIINTVSATTFGVLLIHANSDIMRQWLWKDVLDNVGMYRSNWMPLHTIGSVLIIFVVCSMIDLCRIHFVEKPFFTWLDSHWDCAVEKYKNIENKVCEKLKIE